jgi:hypothetical protein
MKATGLEQAQSRMQLESQTQTKGEVAAEHFGPTAVSDLMTVNEAAAYLRVSVSALYDLTRRRGVERQRHPIPAIK